MIIKLKKGSGIHIKKKNRGKFTSYCGGKVTSSCIAKAKASGNPTLVKRATFAANARKWKHQQGGIIKALFGTNLIDNIKSKIKNRIYRTVTPQGYDLVNATKEFIMGKTRPLNKGPENEEWAKYLGVNFNAPSNFEPATYRPTMGKTYDKVYKFKDESLILSDNVIKLLEDNYKKTGKKSMLVKGNGTGLGSYTLSMGQDEKGKYASYYDDWDINPFKGISSKYHIPIISEIEDIVPGSHPFTVYGRRYYKKGGKLCLIPRKS